MIIPSKRKTDCHGSGEWHAPRGDRVHSGVDYACQPGSVVLSDVEGCVSKIGYPYNPNGNKGQYRYVEVTTDIGDRVRYFYVSPSVSLKQKILKNDEIGVVQDLTVVYKGITPHFHFEIIRNGEYVNPEEYLKGNL